MPKIQSRGEKNQRTRPKGNCSDLHRNSRLPPSRPHEANGNRPRWRSREFGGFSSQKGGAMSTRQTVHSLVCHNPKFIGNSVSPVWVKGEFVTRVGFPSLFLFGLRRRLDNSHLGILYLGATILTRCFCLRWSLLCSFRFIHLNS